MLKVGVHESGVRTLFWCTINQTLYPKWVSLWFVGFDTRSYNSINNRRFLINFSRSKLPYVDNFVPGNNLHYLFSNVFYIPKDVWNHYRMFDLFNCEYNLDEYYSTILHKDIFRDEWFGNRDRLWLDFWIKSDFTGFVCRTIFLNN